MSSSISHFRHDDLKTMLDSNKDNLKLEAMKRIIGVSRICHRNRCFSAKGVQPLKCSCDVTIRHLYNGEICFQMVAKGKDASELFPAVVKNVVSKNIEVGRS